MFGPGFFGQRSIENELLENLPFHSDRARSALVGIIENVNVAQDWWTFWTSKR
jgi:hypothetical protein